MVKRNIGAVLAIFGLMLALLAPLAAQNTGQRGTITFVNATNATITTSRWGGTVYVTNMTGNHTLTIANASTLAPGSRLRVVEVAGKLSTTGNLTISSVSNINGVANYSLDKVTYQGVDIEAFCLNSTAVNASNYRATALAKACYNP